MERENKTPRDENDLKHGLWERYYSNGYLGFKGLYIHGLRYGYWELYHFNNEFLDTKKYYIK